MNSDAAVFNRSIGAPKKEPNARIQIQGLAVGTTAEGTDDFNDAPNTVETTRSKGENLLKKLLLQAYTREKYGLDRRV